LELNDYQREANRTDQRPGVDEGALLFPVIGLSSEVGSLVRHVKKRLRDQDAYGLFSGEMADELGDVLWYVANLAEKLDVSLDEIASANLEKIRAAGASAHPLVSISPTSCEEAAQPSAAERTLQACFRVDLGTPSRSIISRQALGARGWLKRTAGSEQNATA
jgi:NTP pyrophosphatase (non-canonical NTP hydrolase)